MLLPKSPNKGLIPQVEKRDFTFDARNSCERRSGCGALLRRERATFSLSTPKSASSVLEGYLNMNRAEGRESGPFCSQVVTLLLTANENTSLHARTARSAQKMGERAATSSRYVSQFGRHSNIIRGPHKGVG